MPDQNVFAGQSTYIPSVNITVNTSALTPVGTGPIVVGLMGIAQGGVPNTPTTLYTSQQAMALLRGGDLLEATLRAFQPSDVQPGASKIVVVRVNPAVQATGTLLDGSSGNTIALTSANYGALDNGISVNIAAGSVSGTKATVNFNGTGSNPGTQALSYVSDNILKNSFTLLYTGSSVSATATINETTLTTTTTIGGAENLNISFASFPTVAQLVTYINTAYPTLYTAVVTTTNPNDPTLNGLDHITTQTIKTTAYQVTANVNAIISAINLSGIVTAVRAPSTTGLLPANQTILLSGGSEGTTTNTQWQSAVTAMSTQAVNLEVVLSGTSTVWGYLASSVASVSANGLYARRGIVGTSSGQSESTISANVTSAAALNNDRIAFVTQGINDIDPLTGSTTLFPGYIVAAQLAGLMAGSPVGTSITNVELKGQSCEWNPSTADLQTMIAGGILPLQFTPIFNYIRVVRGISTWLKDNNFFRVEFATGLAIDQTVQMLMVGLQPLIGQGVTTLTLNRIASLTASILADALTLGYIVGTPSNPLGYTSITVTGSGDTATVAFTAAFIIPLNFINVNITATSYQGIVTTQVAV